MAQPLSTIGGIKNDVIVKLGISTTSAYYTDAILDDWIDTAHRWAAKYKKWPFTEGRISTTFVNTTTDELGTVIMEYPEGWSADSIRLLQIGAKKYDKKNFFDFQRFREQNPQSDEKIYSDFARRIYINPVGGASGTLVAYGQYTPAHFDYTDPNQYTVFSDYDEDGNKAIVDEVLSYAYTREKQSMNLATQYHQNAIDRLELLYKNTQDEQANYQMLSGEGMFKRFDVTRGGFKEDLFKRDQWFS